jgi:histidine triad (HIT) family protein
MTCIFCKIAKKEISSDFLYESEKVVAFNDLTPQAPVHVLIIPKAHFENAGELSEAEPLVLAELFTAAKKIAHEHGLDGYRTAFNTGASAGQSVFHAHLHLFGGRPFAWPPG